MAKKKAGFSKFRNKLWAFIEIERQIRVGLGCTCKSLGRDLDVNPRTVRRHIVFLRDELGAPIEFDPIDQTYVMTNKTWTMPNVHLSVAELESLAIAARSMSAVMPAPFNESLEKLLAKLLDALPEDRGKEIRLLQDRVDFVSSSVTSKGQEWVAVLIDAMTDEHVVEMNYFAVSRGEEKMRKIDPYHLRFFAGAWYLVGYDHERKQFPIFNLARIRSLTITDDTFRRKDFSAAEYFRHAVGVTVGGPPRPVRILLAGRAAETASERNWPDGFTYTPQQDGSGILAGQLSKLHDLLAWIAAVGGDATILQNSPSPSKKRRRNRT